MNAIRAEKCSPHLPITVMTAMAVFSVVLLVGAAMPAHADEHREHPGDHRDWDDRDHRRGDGRYYRPPPVVYGSPYYPPPPVVYGPTVGVYLPGLSVGFR